MFLCNLEDKCLNFTSNIMKEKAFDYMDLSRQAYQSLFLNSLSMLAVCGDIRIRETIYLCKEHNRSEEAIKILDGIILDSNKSSDKELIEQVIKVMYRIVKNQMKTNDTVCYPAKLLTDIYIGSRCMKTKKRMSCVKKMEQGNQKKG